MKHQREAIDCRRPNLRIVRHTADRFNPWLTQRRQPTQAIRDRRIVGAGVIGRKSTQLLREL